jgi:DNA-binding HxlR family transcriptional regulator
LSPFAKTASVILLPRPLELPVINQVLLIFINLHLFATKVPTKGILLLPVYKRILKMNKRKKEEEWNFQDKIKFVQDTHFVIGGKWKLPIIISIYNGHNRFNEILQSIPKITNRVLSKELRHLEENLLVSRKVYDDYPARIEYTLTEYSNSVTEVLVAMEKWGKQHRERIKGKM